jgi:hypothetical protein
MIRESIIDYMGDGVYIEWDGYAYWLRANDHRDSRCTDKICLESSVLSNIVKFAIKMESKKNESSTNV